MRTSLVVTGVSKIGTVSVQQRKTGQPLVLRKELLAILLMMAVGEAYRLAAWAII